MCALWSLIPRLVLDPRKPFSSPSIVIIRKCTFQAFRPKIRTQDLSQFIPKPIIVKIRYTFQRFQSFPRGIQALQQGKDSIAKTMKNTQYCKISRCPLLDFKLSLCVVYIGQNSYFSTYYIVKCLSKYVCKYSGPSEGLEIWGCQHYLVGIICPSWLR